MDLAIVMQYGRRESNDSVHPHMYRQGLGWGNNVPRLQNDAYGIDDIMPIIC